MGGVGAYGDAGGSVAHDSPSLALEEKKTFTRWCQVCVSVNGN